MVGVVEIVTMFIMFIMIVDFECINPVGFAMQVDDRLLAFGSALEAPDEGPDP